MRLPVYVGMWVRNGSMRGTIKEIRSNSIVIELRGKMEITLTESELGGWEYFTSVTEEGQWLPLDETR